MVVFTSACGSDGSKKSEPADAVTSSTGGGGTNTGKIKGIGVALSGLATDGAYFQGVWEASQQAAKDHGTTAKLVDQVTDPTQQATVLRQLGDSSDLLIFDHELAAAFESISGELKKQAIITSGSTKPGESKYGHAYLLAYGYPSYVLGQAATKISKSGKYGYVAAIEAPALAQAKAGFEEGIKSVQPQANLVSTTTGSFDDVAKAQAAADAMIANGVDVIYGFVDNGFAGIIRAAENASKSGKKVNLFGVIVNRCSSSPTNAGHVFGDIRAMVKSAVDDYTTGKLPDGTRVVKLDKPEIQRAELCPSVQTPELADFIKTASAEVNSGAAKLSPKATGTESER
jgi:basic membrane lipoprotein Med (substrate-binding protein (PBP1-ABC) superfamily)